MIPMRNSLSWVPDVKTGIQGIIVALAVMMTSTADAKKDAAEVHACHGEDARQESIAALNAFESVVFRAGVSFQEIIDSWGKTAKAPCFRLVSRLIDFRPTSIESVRRWWKEGGESFLASYLRPKGRHGGRLLSLTPEFRDTLSWDAWTKLDWELDDSWTSERFSANLPKQLFCARDNGQCDPDAERTLFVAEDYSDRTFCSTDPLDPPEDRTRAACEKEVLGLPVKKRFREFLRCIDWRPRSYPRFPVGSFQLPRSGWLLIYRERGDCVGTRAYNVDDGSFYRIETCSGYRIFKRYEDIDGELLRSHKRKEVTVGRISPNAVRQFLLLAALRPYVGKRKSYIDYFELPPDVPAVWTPTRSRGRGLLGCLEGGMTHQMTLPFDWWHDGKRLFSGSFLWGGPVDNIQGHIAKLLSDAERTVIEGCVYSHLPTELQRNLPQNKATEMFKTELFAAELCKPPASP